MDYFDAEARERDLPFRTDGDALANLSEQRAALACLRDVVLRSEFEDMRTPAVLSALDFLSVGLGAGGDHACGVFAKLWRLVIHMNEWKRFVTACVQLKLSRRYKQ